MMADPLDVSLLETARTGRVGPIRLGLDGDDVARLLGPPDAWGGLPSRYDRLGDEAGRAAAAARGVWTYGDIELHFVEARLRMIFSDRFGESVDGCGAMRVDSWVVRRGASLEAVCAELERAELEHKIVREDSLGQVHIMTTGGLRFHFDEEGLIALSIGELA